MATISERRGVVRPLIHVAAALVPDVAATDAAKAKAMSQDLLLLRMDLAPNRRRVAALMCDAPSSRRSTPRPLSRTTTSNEERLASSRGGLQDDPCRAFNPSRMQR